MGTLTITTTASDDSGSRSSSGSIAPGGTHGPSGVNGYLSICERRPFSDVMVWTPGPDQSFVSMSISGPSVSGVSLGSDTISGNYLDEFDETYVEWTSPQADVFTVPVYNTGARWADIPVSGIDNLVDLTTALPIDRQYTYTITVEWIDTTVPAPGAPEVFTFISEVYMDFWFHKDKVLERV